MPSKGKCFGFNVFIYAYMCISVRYIFMGHDIKYMGFPGGSTGKEFACNAGDLGSVPGLRRSPGGGHSNLHQYSFLENSHGRRSLGGYSP